MRPLIRQLIGRGRRDPGGALLVLALVAVALLYAPVLDRGVVAYDDPWIVGSNWIARTPSWHSLHAIWLDLSPATRLVLGAEYLPVRDLSVMGDFALWGTWWGGHHLTSLVAYEAAIALWFGAFVAFGVDRRVAGLAILVWALHPSHAESVAWLAERKGVLGVMFAGACALGYAKFRADGPTAKRWLALAIACGVLAVWSKATAAFAVAALAGLELALPARRVSWRRSLGGLAAIGAAAIAAYVPVVVLALRYAIVGASANALPVSRAALVTGVHGFYLRLAAMTLPNAIAYPIGHDGPSSFDVVLGVLGFAALLAAFALRRTPAAVRAGALVWTIGWLPASHLILPLQQIVVADRLLLVPTLGLALAAAAGIAAIRDARFRIALGAVVAIAAALRTLDAQASWQGTVELEARAIASSPHDGDAWAMYVEGLDQTGHHDLAERAVAAGLAPDHAPHAPRLELHEALILDEAGDRAGAMAAMREAADAGEPRAMTDLAKWLLDAGKLDDALAYARRAVDQMPAYPAGQRMRGKVALAAGHPDEALAAFERAYALERSGANQLNLGLALMALGRSAEARRYLEPLETDPELGPRARALLGSAAPQRP